MTTTNESSKLKTAIEKDTGRKVPDSAVIAFQYAFRIECFDAEGVCAFSDRAGADGALYRAGIDRFGISLVA